MTTSTSERVRYVGVEENKRALVAALKASFPGVTFSVQEHDGGFKATVVWVGGPAQDDVEEVASQFGRSEFYEYEGLTCLKQRRAYDTDGCRVSWVYQSVMAERSL